MATVTGYTAQRMKQIEDKAIVDGEVRGDNLWLIPFDQINEIDAGSVRGPQGIQGPPGEVTQAQLNAKTGVSAQAGNSLLLGSDGKPYFNHTTTYVGNVPIFADTAQRDAAIPTPVIGQKCVVAGAEMIWSYTYVTDSQLGWVSPGGVVLRSNTTADSGSVSTNPLPITGLNIPFWLPASKRVKFTYTMNVCKPGTATGAIVRSSIRLDNVQVVVTYMAHGPNGFVKHTAWTEKVVPAGVHSAQAYLSSDFDVANVTASPDSPAHMDVEITHS